MLTEEVILNLGCGSQTYGTHRLDFIKTEATTLVWNLENRLPYASNFADKIYSRNLFEHLRNPGFFLDECFRVLKVGGTLELITDNASCIRFYIFGTHTGRYEKIHIGDHHLSIFTKNHLRNHLESAGFLVKELRYEKTDTLGRFFDSPISAFLMPRLYSLSVKVKE